MDLYTITSGKVLEKIGLAFSDALFGFEKIRAN